MAAIISAVRLRISRPAAMARPATSRPLVGHTGRIGYRLGHGLVHSALWSGRRYAGVRWPI